MKKIKKYFKIMKIVERKSHFKHTSNCLKSKKIKMLHKIILSTF